MSTRLDSSITAAFDPDGFLIDPAMWSANLANRIARTDDIELDLIGHIDVAAMTVEIIEGEKLRGVEFDSAASEVDSGGYVIGSKILSNLAERSLLFVDDDRHQSKLIGMKCYLHKRRDTKGPREPAATDEIALTMLVSRGEWKQRIWNDKTGKSLTVLLKQPGDYIAWQSGLWHEWWAVKKSMMLTVRWKRVSGEHRNEELDLEKARKVIERLVAKRKLSKEERDYVEVLSNLVENAEAKLYPLPKVSQAYMLAHLLEAKGVTQAELAYETGISPENISAVRSGDRKFGKADIAKLSGYFRTSSDACA